MDIHLKLKKNKKIISIDKCLTKEDLLKKLSQYVNDISIFDVVPNWNDNSVTFTNLCKTLCE
ncbi:hypothetical protein FACS1894166_07880 [Bacilli bacterium]|nr:hypothetical protein FACS1894166_07880 [Bacilli bacterium]